MRVLVLGGTGMLGHRVWIQLAPHHEVWASVRGSAGAVPRLPDIDRSKIMDRIDVNDDAGLERVVDAARPDVVVNCVGIVKQSAAMAEPIQAIRSNSLLPHRISRLAAAVGARVIHISTDCVFSGKGGRYTEDDVPDASDLYGRSKLLGEITLGSGDLTLRTSMIGRELRTSQGLVEWFIGSHSSVRGFRRAIFSGLPTDELARVIRQHVLPRSGLRGLYHVASDPIDKYELLCLLRRAYGHRIDVAADDSVKIDRSLDGSRFAAATGYSAPSWPEMVDRMVSGSKRYDEWRQR